MESPLVHCLLCGDRIGVYEPLVVIGEGFAHETSQAAEPGVASRGACYHHSCWERRHEAPVSVEGRSA
jgi:hypothetical protein